MFIYKADTFKKILSTDSLKTIQNIFNINLLPFVEAIRAASRSFWFGFAL